MSRYRTSKGNYGSADEYFEATLTEKAVKKAERKLKKIIYFPPDEGVDDEEYIPLSLRDDTNYAFLIEKWKDELFQDKFPLDISIAMFERRLKIVNNTPKGELERQIENIVKNDEYMTKCRQKEKYIYTNNSKTLDLLDRWCTTLDPAVFSSRLEAFESWWKNEAPSPSSKEVRNKIKTINKTADKVYNSRDGNPYLASLSDSMLEGVIVGFAGKNFKKSINQLKQLSTSVLDQLDNGLVYIAKPIIEETIVNLLTQGASSECIREITPNLVKNITCLCEQFDIDADMQWENYKEKYGSDKAERLITGKPKDFRKEIIAFSISDIAESLSDVSINSSSLESRHDRNREDSKHERGR